MKIEAAVAWAPERPFTIETCDLAEPGPGEAVVRLVACGICHTDLVVKYQHVPIPLPFVLGHEGAGVIEKLGPGMDGFALGDHVVMSFTACGECPECQDRKPGYCDHFVPMNLAGARAGGSGLALADGTPLGGHFFAQSAFATHALASRANMVRVDKDLPLPLLAPLGCGIQTGMGTVLLALAARQGESLAVFGTGPVGLAGVIAGVIAGCETIVAVDLKPERLALARDLGATHTLNGATDDVAARLREITGGRGVQCALDTTGHPAVVAQAFNGLARRGRAACVAAPPAGTAYSIDAYALLNSGASIRGVVEGDAVPADFIPTLIGHYRAGRLPLEKIVTLYPFARINEAVADSESGAALKAVLVMDAGWDGPTVP
jgi:aryl-alcohol dehydrogenase